MTRKLSRVCAGRVALIGDASGSVDAITGEGLCLAFQQAELLATCLASGNMAAYQVGHRRLALRPTCMAWLMLLLERQNGVRRRVMHAFVNEPKLFTRMLALHVGVVSPLNVAACGVALGWKVLSV
jgi:flavin-dependent dehydrogenase